MKYYIIAGEASGDLHGSNLIQALKKDDLKAEFRCWGGDLMEDQGAVIVKHYRDLAFMGFLEVVANLRTILRNLSFCKQDILDWKPDAIILIDYPGFNLRIAEFGKKAGIKIIYYISPQIWAWKESRINRIKRDVDKMFVILPFEKEFYHQRGMEVEFVGHPLIDAIGNRKWAEDDWEKRNNIPEGKKLIALLPGSRKQEIETMLPIMLSATENLDQFHFILAVAPSQPLELYLEIIGARKDITLIRNQTYAILSKSSAALVTSGTATLETALFGVPEVVCYKGNVLSYWIARQLVKVKYISLVNLVMDQEIVKELIQDELQPKNLQSELMKLFDRESRQTMLKSFEALKIKLGGQGASKNTSNLIIKYLSDLSKV
ncbi:MAG: lipid-A-disaccharide synthase [Bacteroidetes bacterium]|nr:lipid-A-disaccharide synthase [Bacteroidota bacterium]